MWWLAHGEHEVPASRGWLTAHEYEHLASIRYTKRRDEYVTRRWTTKRAVAAVLGLDGDDASLARVEVRHRESGAPYVQVDGEMADVDVSMSDRAGWAVCLVGSATIIAVCEVRKLIRGRNRALAEAAAAEAPASPAATPAAA